MEDLEVGPLQPIRVEVRDLVTDVSYAVKLPTERLSVQFHVETGTIFLLLEQKDMSVVRSFGTTRGVN